MHISQKKLAGIRMKVVIFFFLILSYWDHQFVLEDSFATASGTNGYLYVWDATRLVITDQLNVHSAIINRLQFHPRGRVKN